MAKTKKKKASKRKDNEIRLRFIPQDLFDRIAANADREKRTHPDEILLHLEKTYK